jgi:sugar O-acyltransferase (sialic acid O-acetyltransferase NeuD family)
MLSSEVVIWGGRGHAKVLRDTLDLVGTCVVAIIDNNFGLPSPFTDLEIFYGKMGLRDFITSSNHEKREKPLGAVVAIGGANGQDRADCYNLMKEMGLQIETVVHPSAVVARSSRLGSGAQILGGAFVGSSVKIGDFCIVNSGAIVDHDCLLGRGVHIAPGAVVTGEIEIGDYSFVGANATILPGLKLGECVIVGAGSVVTRDVSSCSTVIGSPATTVLKSKPKKER